MSDDIYCGIEKVPKGKRRGTAMECAEKKQIRYWGVAKADDRVLSAFKNTGAGDKKIKALEKQIEKYNFEVIRYNVLAKKAINDLKYAREGEEDKKEKLKNAAVKKAKDIIAEREELVKKLKDMMKMNETGSKKQSSKKRSSSVKRIKKTTQPIRITSRRSSRSSTKRASKSKRAK